MSDEKKKMTEPREAAAEAMARLGAWTERLREHDWTEAFSFANPNKGAIDPVVTPEAVSLESFTAEDVVKVLGIAEGENDAEDWIIAGLLADGRYFYLEAGCDYTGWGCQDWGRAVVTMSKDTLVRLGVPEEARYRFGWTP